MTRIGESAVGVFKGEELETGKAQGGEGGDDAGGDAGVEGGDFLPVG